MSDVELVWTPAGIYQGVFEDFVVLANRHKGEAGQVAWHVTSYNNAGDFGHRDYWVQGGKFKKTIKLTVGPNTVQTGDVLEDDLDPERQAILLAIANFANREPDSLFG